MERKRVRGKWEGLTSITVAELAGCSVWKAKNMLYSLEKPVTLERIGEMIYEYRLKKESTSLGKYYSSRSNYWV